METLFGSDIQLLSKSGTVAASSLTQKTAVLLYFSAHWCPPCRSFTPLLAAAYEDFSAQKNFEIIFISSDKDQASFDSYYAEHPWLALPFSERSLKEKLSAKFKVNGIPSLVVLSPDGQLITDKGRAKVSEDPKFESFPWKPKSFSEIFTGELINGNKEKVSIESLKDKTAVGIYFSAHWCPPCRGFTPKLVDTYNKIKAAGKSFEIIFASSDRDQAAFDEYFGEMPWLAIPLGSPMKAELSDFFNVEGIPTFVIINPSTGETISTNGRGAVASDPEGKDFPWLPKSLNSIEMAGDELNERACFCLLSDSISEQQQEELKTFSNKLWEQWKGEGKTKDDFPLCFFYGPATSGLGQRIRDFAKITEDNVAVIINIPETKKYMSDAKNYQTFISNFLEGKETGVPLQ